MARYPLNHYVGDLHFEDADISVINQGFAALASSGLSEETVQRLRNNIEVYECSECSRKWAHDGMIFVMPSWELQNSGRGRKTKLDKTREALTEWRCVFSESRCEPCLLSRADKFAAALLTVDNKDLKRFFKVFLARVEHEKSDKGVKFHSWIGYRFYVKFVTALFDALPKKRSTAFAAMTTVMHELDLF